MTTKFPISDADFSRFTPEEQGELFQEAAAIIFSGPQSPVRDSMAWFIHNFGDYLVKGKAVPHHKVAKHLTPVPDLPTISGATVRHPQADKMVLTGDAQADPKPSGDIVINIYTDSRMTDEAVGNAARSALSYHLKRV